MKFEQSPTINAIKNVFKERFFEEDIVLETLLEDRIVVNPTLMALTCHFNKFERFDQYTRL